jgi:hypothetical protein
MFKKIKEFTFLLAKILLVTGVFSTQALAYPQFIGMQYTSCLTCHYNPMGNGPINDYGRGVSATGIAGRLTSDAEISEEDLVAHSVFPGVNPEKNTWLRPFLGYRGLGLENNAFTGNSKRRWINMQLDANLVIKGGARDQYIASFTLGTRPTGINDQNNLIESKSFSREHYIGWRPIPKVGLYAGKMDKVYGIRIPDHNLSSRRATKTAQFNQVHGLMVHGVGESLEGAAHYFVGDLNEHDEDLRDKGFSGLLEWGVTERQRLGISYMNSSTNLDSQTAMAIHDRIGFGKGHSIMTEWGQISRKPDGGESTTSRYGLLQTHILWLRGIWLTGTFDYYRRDTEIKDESYGVGPGLQWFPWQKTELRLDVLNRRIFSETSTPEDAWQLLMQVHVWL